MFGLFVVWTWFTVLPVFRHDHKWSCFGLDLSRPQSGLSDVDVMFDGRLQGLRVRARLAPSSQLLFLPPALSLPLPSDRTVPKAPKTDICSESLSSPSWLLALGTCKMWLGSLSFCLIRFKLNPFSFAPQGSLSQRDAHPLRIRHIVITSLLFRL